jgi:hypothetical protein
MNATVFRVALAAYERGGFECLNDPRHRGRPDLLCGCELAEGSRAAEDEHRQGGKLSGWNTGRRIFAADVSQRVDRRRVEAVGSIG